MSTCASQADGHDLWHLFWLYSEGNTKKLYGSLKITDRTFTDELKDTSSEAYKQLAEQVSSVVRLHSIYSSYVVFSLV